MGIQELVRLALGSMWRSRAVTATLVIALAIGLSAGALVYGSSCIGSNYQNLSASDDRDDANELGLIVVGPSWPGLQGDELEGLTKLSDLVAMLRYLGCAVSPEVVCGDQQEKVISTDMGSVSMACGLIGVSSEFLRLHSSSASIGYGEFFKRTDVEAQLLTAVIGYSIAVSLFGDPSEAIGRSISIDGVGYTVTGVLAHGSTFESASGAVDADGSVILPYTTLVRHSLDRPDYPLSLVMVEYERPTSLTDRFIHRVTIDWLRRNGILSRRFISDAETYVVGASDFTAPDRLVRMAVYLLAVILSAVNVGNVSAARITHRSKELAIAQSVGAPPSRLVAEAFMENLIISLLAGVLAVALTIGVGVVMAQESSDIWSGMQYHLSGRVLLFVLSASLLTASLSTVVPAWRILAMDIPSAMNGE